MQLDQFKEKYNYTSATLVMKQFLDIKFANIDCLLLFRMGDFYELFYEDAITASRVLGITLTKRGKTGDQKIAMCGVPHHALENYLNKLLENGFKVAICNQLETPEEAKASRGYKALIKRSITRIITPGTIIEESLLEVAKPNYLVSIMIKKQLASIAAVDLSTSDIFVVSLSEDEIVNELARLEPKEILLSEKYRSSKFASIITSLDMRISFLVDSSYVANKCEKNILDFYKISALSGIGELKNEQISALGSIVEYITLTQKGNLPKLPKPKILNYRKFMSIDAFTRRNLEINTTQTGGIKGSLFFCIDNTVSKSGSRLFYNYLSAPLVDISSINKRLAVTKFFYENLSLVGLIRKNLKKTGDLERSITRLNMRRNTPKDLLSIKYTIKIAESIHASFVSKVGIILPENIERIIKHLLGQNELYELIYNSIREDAQSSIAGGKIIKSENYPKIAELYNLIDTSQSEVNKLRDQYRIETAIDTLKISNNNVIGLFIDITARHANKILDDKFVHRQTTANSIRYTTKKLQELENKMVKAKLLVVGLEQEIYNKICLQIVDNQQKLLSLANSLNMLDVYCNFAFIADEYNYCMPELSDDICFEIEDGRHPIVEHSLKKTAESFIYNDCKLSMNERIRLITGPNMGGKSIYLRQNAIIAILAHIGSYVPAKVAKIGMVDKIFSRIGAGDNLNKGQSTFMLEMLETAAILAQGTPKSLIILDEVGRGTSTYDGVAIAWSVLEHIHDKIQARCLFATHYHELTAMEDILPALTNYTVSIDDQSEKFLFLHKIKKGAADKSYGVHVAEIAGLPKSVIKKAKNLLKFFEKDSAKMNKQLLKNESLNLSLFEVTTANFDSKKYKNLFDEVTIVDPDKLSPREALEVLYRLKELSRL